MSGVPINDSQGLTQGEWNVAPKLDLVRAGGLDQPDSSVTNQTPVGAGREAPSSSLDLLDTAIPEQVFADMV